MVKTTASLEEKFAYYDKSIITLLDNMLKFDPKERFSAEECLESSIFDDLLRNENL